MTTTSTELLVPGPHGPVPLRVHDPEGAGPGGPALLWCHGGAFTQGDLDMPEADHVARTLAGRTGRTVVTVDYRLAAPAGAWARWPVRWPVPSDDVLAAWEWTTREFDPPTAVLGGASAGANLAAGALLRLLAARGTGGRHSSGTTALPAGLVLAYPTLHVVQPPPSPALSAALDDLPADENRWGPDAVRAMYADLLGPDGVDDPPLPAVPGLARPEDVADFCSTLVLVSEVDGLRPSAEGFAATLAAAGVDTTVHLERGARHGHLNRPAEPACAASLDVVAEWVRR